MHGFEVDIQPPLDDDVAQEFATALRLLMAEFSFDDLIISDICDKAGYSRKTFYTRFSDKYHLLNWVLFSAYAKTTDPSASRYNAIRGLVEVASESPSFFSTVIHENQSGSGIGSYFSRLLYASIYRGMHDDLSLMLDDEDEIDFCIGFITEFIRRRIVNWIDSGCESDVDEFLSDAIRALKAASVVLGSHLVGMPGERE